MKFSGWITGVALATLFSMTAGAAPAPDRAEVAFRAALEKETVEGDLKGAIEQYKKLAQNNNKSVAARALLRLGECYEKQGSADARKAYEQVLSRFSDQKQAVEQARARLAALAGVGAAGATRIRLVWDNAEDLWGSVSADGRYMSFVDWQTGGQVGIRDLATGESRSFSGPGEYSRGKGETGANAISPDGKRVAFAYLSYLPNGRRNNYNELHLIGADGSGHRVLLSGEDIGYIEPHSWSADGRRIAGVVQRQSKPTIVVVSPDDGKVRFVPTPDDGWRAKVVFSPDGKWLAYSRRPRNSPRTLCLTPADATAPSETVLQEDASMMGWTPDGSGILFVRQRAGTDDLYLLPVSQGRPSGQPQAITGVSAVGSNLLGVTTGGSLLFGTYNRRSDASIFAWDGNPANLKKPATTFATKQDTVLEMTGGLIRFSPDGNRLFGIAPNGGVRLYDLASGGERTVTPQMKHMARAEWTHEGAALLIAGAGMDGAAGLYRVDTVSGGAVRVGGERLVRAFVPSRDGKTLFYLRANGGVFAHDLGTGQDKLLAEGFWE